MTNERSEFARIALIERLLSAQNRPGGALELGIGDDAALLYTHGAARLVWTIDAQVEGVHFDRRWLSWEEVGYRSYQAAVSDLAAMGAEPLGALSNLSLPVDFSDRALASLVRGQAEAARATQCPLIGGNLSKSSALSVTTTALGRTRHKLLRSGARAGDELWLVGDVGLAALGLARLSGKLRPKVASRTSTRALATAVESWRRPKALLAEGQALHGRARAALDVSDGLAGDSAHLARASGVRVVIEEERLREALPSALVSGTQGTRLDPLGLALYGGEDYALLATGPARKRPEFAQAIGSVERGRGVFLRDASGKLSRLGKGFDHFET